MNKKFDGPSFVKPEHTSYNLSNGNNYQTPKMNFENKKEEIQGNSNIGSKNSNNNVLNKKGPKGGWEDDEESQVKPKSNLSNKKGGFNFDNKTKTSSTDVNTTSVSSSNFNQNSNSAPNFKKEENKKGDGVYINYWDAESTKKIQNSTLSV